MAWLHTYHDRAQSLAQLGRLTPEFQVEWNALEDDILGKLSLTQCDELRAFCMQAPVQGSMVILAMLPENDS